MNLTVLMATHNGAKTLSTVLGAYTTMKPPIGDWQVVVVDNASTDSTPAILHEFSTRLPLIAIRTEQRGKNLALNLGIPACTGDLVILTDDDAVPSPDWLLTMSEIATKHADFDVFGGQIDPIWPDGHCPDWIARTVNLGATFAITPLGLTEGPTSAASIWGPNMAIRRKVFDAGHRFDESVGPAAGQYIMGSEVEFTCRIERHGHRAWFSPRSKVGHLIRASQLEPKWIIQRGYRLGRHMFHQDSLGADTTIPMFRGAPRWMWRKFIQENIRAVMARLRRDADERFLADWEVSFLRGYLDEATRQASRESA